VKPDQGLSTPAVYQSGKAVFTDGLRARAFRDLLREKKLPALAGSLFNGLEPAAFFLMPETKDIKEGLLRAGAMGALVSGSGPTVFGVARDRAEAEGIAGKMKAEGRTVLVTRTVPGKNLFDDGGKT
jgi:4-diphosphocytidyl-2-C-methyl-D-erythritol kinase